MLYSFASKSMWQNEAPLALRTTIQLDESLLARVRTLVPPRKLNRFIVQALAEKVEAIEREQLEETLKEGYLASAEEDAEVAADWEVTETEGWPD